MFGFRPSPLGWWLIGGTLLLFALGALWPGFLFLGIALGAVVGLSLFRHVNAAPKPEIPDPIAQMVTFKAHRRREEANEWMTEYNSALYDANYRRAGMRQR